MDERIELVAPEVIYDILHHPIEIGPYDTIVFPRGKGKMFMCRERNGLENGWTGVDNTTGDAWTEWFPTMCDCLNWLVGRIDSDGYLEESVA